MARQLFQYHPTIGYTFIPEIKARIDHEGGGYLLRTNASGFRCRHDFVAGKPDGCFRILLFGDSYTAGDGVSDKDRYSEALEKLLPGCEVYNFGLSGTGTDQQYLIWREFAAGIEHDLVVISVLVENIRRVAAQFRPFLTQDEESLVLAKPYFTLGADGDLSLHQVPVPKDPLAVDSLAAENAAAVDRGGRLQWLRGAVNRLGPRAKDFVQRVTRYQPLPEFDRPDRAEWRLLEAILRHWIDELATPAIICPLPLYQYIEGTASPRAYQQRFQVLHDPPRVRVHDPLPAFRAHAPAARRGFRFDQDCHLTPAAHQVLAESLAGFIQPLMARESG
jgi:Fe-S-cluster formation regulator IscX/YfhJ